jgi:hypothetical protein
MWVTILLARHLHRVGGWHTPGLSRERAAAGKALAKDARSRRREMRGGVTEFAAS